MTRNPIKDQIAIVGVGSTGFSRDARRSGSSLAVEAATKAIRDAGLKASDIKGIVSTGEAGAPSPNELAAMLGMTDVTHYDASRPVALFAFINAINAVFSGSADYVLVYNAVMRTSWNSSGASNDPFRGRATGMRAASPDTIRMAPAYTAWASRYIHDYNVPRETFGRIAVNMRSNAARNPGAVFRTPMTMDDYLAARMIRDPLCLFDMDTPVDGADAFVVTTADRARDLPHRPVLVHAATTGAAPCVWEDQLTDLQHHGQHIVVNNLRAKSDIGLTDVDFFGAYDGFTMITIGWIENAGWCGPGEATGFLQDHWDDASNRILINGRVPINTHGGALSEGATRGSGYIRESTLQLRGEADDRQVANAKTALVAVGGFFFNAQGMVLRTE